MLLSDSYMRFHCFHSYTFWIMLYYLFAPLEDLLTGSIGTVAKYFAIIIVLLGLYCSGGIIDLEWNVVSKCLFYLILLSFVSCIWATDFSVAINRNTAYLLVSGFALFVGQLEFSPEEYEAIMTAAIMGGLVTVTYLVISGQVDITGTQRLNLIKGNDQNNFAALMFLPFGLCVGRLFNQETFKRFLYAVFAMVFLYIILLTGSRGGLLAVLLFIGMIVFFSSKGSRIRSVIGMAVLLLFAYYVILPMLPEFIQARLFDNGSYRNTMNSESNRIAFWKLAFQEIIPKNLPFGVGSGCTPSWLGRFYSVNRGMHNTYINMLCEYGFFGLPVFLWMLWSLFKEKICRRETVEVALLAGICLIIFFLDAYPKKFFWNVIMLLMIGSQAKKDDLQKGGI